VFLSKVYVDEDASGKKLAAERIALAVKGGDGMRLRELKSGHMASKDFDVAFIDAINFVSLLKRR
jgi:hypothetical protein